MSSNRFISRALVYMSFAWIHSLKNKKPPKLLEIFLLVWDDSKMHVSANRLILSYCVCLVNHECSQFTILVFFIFSQSTGRPGAHRGAEPDLASGYQPSQAWDGLHHFPPGQHHKSAILTSLQCKTLEIHTNPYSHSAVSSAADWMYVLKGYIFQSLCLFKQQLPKTSKDIQFAVI